MLVGGDEVEPPWAELPRRLEEAAVVRILEAIQHQGHKCRHDKIDEFWTYASPLAAAAQAVAEEAES